MIAMIRKLFEFDRTTTDVVLDHVPVQRPDLMDFPKLRRLAAKRHGKPFRTDQKMRKPK